MRARAVAAIALSGALALGLSGCNLYMHVETARHYDPSDGVGLSLETLELRNLIVISEDGELGNLIGTAVNTTAERIDFSVQWKVGGEYQKVELTAEPNTSTTFGVDEQVLIEPLGEQPGGLLEMIVHVRDGQKALNVPVLDTTLAEYEVAAPTPKPTPTPTPTETATTEADDADAETPEG